MSLLKIKSELEATSRRRIKSISACKIYYVHDGRNAWHGTWIQRWYEDSFHLRWEDARMFAEKSRKQGSVFHIIEIPAFAIHFSKGYALITELNVEAPLLSYRPPADKFELGKRFGHAGQWWRFYPDLAPALVHRQLENVTRQGKIKVFNYLDEAINSFCDESLFWAHENSNRTIVRLLGSNSEGLPEVLTKRKALKAWRSRSVGGGWYLSWNQMTGPFKSRGIFNLLSMAVMGKSHIFQKNEKTVIQNP